MRHLIIWTLLITVSINLWAQNCGSTPPIITGTTPAPVICLGDSTPIPVLSDTGSVLPQLEYIIVNNDRLQTGSPIIIGASRTGVFDPFLIDQLTPGEEFCLVPIRYDIQQVKQLVDGVLNGSIFPGVPCCAVVETILDDVCVNLALNNIYGADDIEGLDQILTLMSILLGGDLTLASLNTTVQVVNFQLPIIPDGCKGGLGNEICFAFDIGQKACYVAGFEVSTQTDLSGSIGGSSASATVTPQGGAAPYTYVWNTGETSNTLSNAVPGVYTVTITDNTGCGTAIEVELSDSCSLLTAFIAPNPVSCFGMTDGAVEFRPSGGSAPYVVTRVGFGSRTVGEGQPAVFNNIGVGTHDFTIVDDSGCAISYSLPFYVADSIVASLSLPSDTVRQDDSVQLGVDTVYGGEYPLVFDWTFGDGSSVNNDFYPNHIYDTTGEYIITLTIEDDQGCIKILTDTLMVFAAIPPDTTDTTDTMTVIVPIQKLDITLFPNPSNGSIIIDWHNSDSPLTDIEVTNSAGQLVREISIIKSSERSYRLYVADLAKGLYLIRLNNGNTHVVKKVLIQ